MKNLATCKPTEFVAQTAKIKDAIADWMELIDFVGIRAKKPPYIMIPKDATDEEKKEINEKNITIRKKQALTNVRELLDNMLAKHPKETLNVMALCCFVEPEHVDDYGIDEYFDCIMDMMESPCVMRFFKLLAHLQMPLESI